jgi:hypothetical protein
MRIIEEKEFTYEKEGYIARTYIPDGKSSVYGEIVHKNNGRRPDNMKGIARQFLKPHGIEISTDARVMITHKAVKILMQYI